MGFWWRHRGLCRAWFEGQQGEHFPSSLPRHMLMPSQGTRSHRCTQKRPRLYASPAHPDRGLHTMAGRFPLCVGLPLLHLRGGRGFPALPLEPQTKGQRRCHPTHVPCRLRRTTLSNPHPAHDTRIAFRTWFARSPSVKAQHEQARSVADDMAPPHRSARACGMGAHPRGVRPPGSLGGRLGLGLEFGQERVDRRAVARAGRVGGCWGERARSWVSIPSLLSL